MAERGGFEPPEQLPAQRFSRPPDSATLAPLHPGSQSTVDGSRLKPEDPARLLLVNCEPFTVNSCDGSAVREPVGEHPKPDRDPPKDEQRPHPRAVVLEAESPRDQSCPGDQNDVHAEQQYGTAQRCMGHHRDIRSVGDATGKIW